MLGQLGLALFDDQCPLAEQFVIRSLVLLDDLVAGLGFDACLFRVVDTAWQVAVRFDNTCRTV